jgi:hypothetical protein
MLFALVKNQWSGFPPRDERFRSQRSVHHSGRMLLQREAEARRMSWAIRNRFTGKDMRQCMNPAHASGFRRKDVF